MYLVVGESAAILFDTGYGIAPIEPVIKRITSLPFEIILGHGHWDHVNGAVQFDSAWIGEGDMVLCKRHTSRTARRKAVEKLEKSGVKMPQGFDAEAYIEKLNLFVNLKKLEIGQVFDLGGINAEVVAMEGHTHGSVGLLIKQHHVLLASDAANHQAYMFLDESTSIDDYINMLKRNMQLPFDTFFWGHEDVEYSKNEWFEKFIKVAQNIDAEKSAPFDFPGHDALIYQEGYTSIIFRKN